MIPSPFQQAPVGPSITPKTLNATGQGGQANPPYLQMRSGFGAKPNASAPVITPNASAPGDTMARKNPAMSPMPTIQPSANNNAPPITPAGSQPNPGTPPQRGGQSLGDVYNFMKSDLQNQTKQAKSNAVADASSRGVYYSTPLTGSEADIDTQYLRGLGQLDAGMYGNEQQNQLARLGMATNLSAQGAMNAPASPGPMDFSGLGALFGSSPSSPTSPPVAGTRTGPVITPQKSGEGVKPTQKNY